MVQISYCNYLILPNSVELPMLETANIQQQTGPGLSPSLWGQKIAGLDFQALIQGTAYNKSYGLILDLQ